MPCLSRRNRTMAEKKATYDRVQALLRSGNTADISQVVSSELIVQLRTEEADLVRRKPISPRVTAPTIPRCSRSRCRSAIWTARSPRRRLVLQVRSPATWRSLALMSDSIEASLAARGETGGGRRLANVKLNSLEANLASTRAMYESFVTRLRATQDQDDIQNPESRVISRAPIPTAPSSPHRLLFFVASLPAGLMLGVLVALLAERFQAPLPRQDLRPFAEPAAPVMARAAPALPPVLAELPATSDMRAADFVVDNPGAPYSQALSALLSRVTSGRSGRAGWLALTSPASDAGKSVIALGLARVAAGRGLRTILLDGNFNRPVIALAAGFRSVPAGIAELLRGSAPLSRVLLRDLDRARFCCRPHGRRLRRRPCGLHPRWRNC